MCKILLLLILIPVSLNSKNIGLSGSRIFHKRQELIDKLVLQIKKSDGKKQDIYINRIIKDFGYIGIENLIRYREPSLNKMFFKLNSNNDWYVKYKTIYAFRQYKDIDNDIIFNYLSSDDVLLKDMMLSSLVEMNRKDIVSKLQMYSSYETNIYLKGSYNYFLNIIINNKEKIFKDFNYGIITNKIVRHDYYKSGDTIRRYSQKFSQIFLNDIKVPIADFFIPPIIDYNKELIFKGKRISFYVGNKIKHTGDDCGWFREGASVYAIGKGIVRLIHHSPDWGFLIVIEHKTFDNKYICSIYGHLSKEIYIKAGDIVEKAQKIGTIGLSYSVENGGYGAHLHFGISKGRWLKSKYNYAHNIVVMYKDKPQKVKEYKFIKNGMEMLLENDLILKVSDNQKRNLNDYLFWLKGYEFSKDIDRIWLDPQVFFLDQKK